MAEKALKALKLSSLQVHGFSRELQVPESIEPIEPIPVGDSLQLQEIKALAKPPDGVKLTLEELPT